MLSGSGLGEEIDAHDKVWRLNMAPTKGYEKDVGAKTDIRLLNDHGTQWLWQKYFPYEKNVTYLFDVMLKTDRFENDLHTLVKQHPDGHFGVIPLATTDALNKLMLSEFNLKRVIASTGVIAVLTALHTCDTVDLYHMAHTKGAEKKAYHYWERGDGYEVAQGFHGAFLQQDVFYKRLAINGTEAFGKTGKLSLDGFTKSSCTNDPDANGGDFFAHQQQSFLNVTEPVAAYQAAEAMQKSMMRQMRAIEIKAMETLCRAV
jgi:hypothetical protein